MDNMPHIFDASSLEGKILLLVLEIYPLTLNDIRKYLNTPKQKAEKALQNLARKGLVGLESLPDNTFVTIISGNFRFKGKQTEQLKRVREKLKKRQEWHLPDDEDNVMYG